MTTHTGPTITGGNAGSGAGIPLSEQKEEGNVTVFSAGQVRGNYTSVTDGLKAVSRRAAERGPQVMSAGAGATADDERVQAAEEFATDPVGNAAGVANDLQHEARNLGPDYLDELTGVAVTFAVIFGLLWLARPVLSIIAGVAN